MNKQIFDKIRSYKPDATKSTIDSYVFYVLKVCRDMGYTNEECKPSIFNDTKKVIDLVSSQSMNTQKTKLNAIVVYLKACKYNEDIIEKYSFVIYKLLNKLRKVSDTMEWNDKEKEKLISIKELQLLVHKLKTELPQSINNINDIQKYMDYIIVAITMEFPSRNDMSDAKIIKDGNDTDDKEFNYLVLEKNKIKIILNKYKTQKTYGEQSYEIDNKPLYNNIMKYYDGIQSYYKSNNKKFDSFLLFNLKNLEKLNRNQYTKYLTKLFEDNTGKAISSSMVRKIITSSLIDSSFVEMAKKQQHSASEAFKSYVKF
jgi:hypothetical protein